VPSIAETEAFLDTDICRFSFWVRGVINRLSGCEIACQDGGLMLGPDIFSQRELKPDAIECRHTIVDRADWTTPVIRFKGWSVTASRTRVSVTCHHEAALSVFREIRQDLELTWPGSVRTSEPVAPIVRRKNRAQQRSASRKERAFRMRAEGHTIDAIARELGIHERTVYLYFEKAPSALE